MKKINEGGIKFQFLIGRLKTHLLILKKREKYLFQFLIGRLKTRRHG